LWKKGWKVENSLVDFLSWILSYVDLNSEGSLKCHVAAVKGWRWTEIKEGNSNEGLKNV
jgi:hypothetical protein